MKKILMLIALSSIPAYADIIYDLTDPSAQIAASIWPEFKEVRMKNFDDTEAAGEQFKNTTVTSFKRHESDVINYIYHVKINFSIKGQKKLYITTSENCPTTESKNEQTIVSVNKQNVLFNKYCNKHNEVYLVASTPLGGNFIFNQFKENDFVSFKFPNIIVQFHTKGFMNAWNNYGGNAI